MVLLKEYGIGIKDPQIICDLQILDKSFSKIQEHHSVSENAKLFKLHKH